MESQFFKMELTIKDNSKMVKLMMTKHLLSFQMDHIIEDKSRTQLWMVMEYWLTKMFIVIKDNGKMVVHTEKGHKDIINKIQVILEHLLMVLKPVTELMHGIMEQVNIQVNFLKVWCMINQEEFRLKEELSIADNSS